MPTEKQLANLKPVRTKSEARERGKKGGIKSGEKRRELKTFKEIDSEVTTYEEREKMLEMLKKRVLQGNIRAFEIYRDTMGMKPTEKVVTAEVDQDTIDTVERMINDWNISDKE